jgi:hypothetical protein
MPQYPHQAWYHLMRTSVGLVLLTVATAMPFGASAGNLDGSSDKVAGGKVQGDGARKVEPVKHARPPEPNRDRTGRPAKLVKPVGPILAQDKIKRRPALEGPLNKPGRVQPALRRIPNSLGWTCLKSGGGEYTCTDPKTGTNVCTNDPESSEKVCEVGDDVIPGSKKL